MPFPNQRNIEGALDALRVDRSGRGFPILEGIQIVYNSSIDNLLEPIATPTRYQRYSVAGPAAGRLACIELAAPLDAALSLEYLLTDSTNITFINVGTRVIDADITVIDPALGFVTGTQGGLSLRQIVSTGTFPTAATPGFMLLTALTIFSRGGNALLPILAQPGQVINVFMSATNSLGSDCVTREFPPRT